MAWVIAEAGSAGYFLSGLGFFTPDRRIRARFEFDQSAAKFLGEEEVVDGVVAFFPVGVAQFGEVGFE